MSRIGIVVLAAGASTRLGQPKQLVSFRGESLLAHTVACALEGSDDVVVVSGALREPLETELNGYPVRMIHNPRWESGMSSSVIAGLQALPQAVEGALFLVCDQPMISGALLKEMIRLFSEDNGRIVACRYGDTYGTPVIFPQKLFSDLMALTGLEGAKKVIKPHLNRTSFIDFPEGVLDIDTPEQLRLLNGNNSI